MADFCSQRADAECQVASRCGATLTKDACTTQRTTVCLNWAGSIASPRVFTTGNIANCVNMAKSVYGKTSPITPTDLANLDDACNYVFQGNVASLMPCTVKFDCGPTKRICDKGKCADQMVKGANAQCSDFGAVCTTGQYCKMDATAGTFQCTAKATTGMSCADGTPCVENLRCSAGSCTDRVAAGAACASSADCPTSAPYCDGFAGSVCDTGLLFAPGSASCSGFVSSGVTAGLNPTTSGPGTGGAGGGGMGGTAGSDAGAGGAGGAGGSSADAASGG
jgi:hypothetical protein